ncbi:polar amino acid transport system permease protein [Natronocella acetinitrilica]|uniref:Polar amino acid transport system permease protein n=1 Tax=Natronocella acetinitrilica TaxID=414046 RepID=A0AAE3KCG7_9GAMM|nr:amino acid ABC transporter permease [Natronocella acetinitrilica]MCP1674928.1 polar amino acid transport system permease protein [Natronocella acetinitrilica]
MSNWDIILLEWPRFLSGFQNTLILFGVSSIAAFALGGVLAIGIQSRKRPLRSAIVWYVDGMRMLPFLILAYLLYYGLPGVGIRLDAWTAGLTALIVYHAAYFAEILRGAWANLPRGQMDSAQAHGFQGRRLFTRIILPQLVLGSGPVMCNQLIILLKDTAFLMIITVTELTYAASSVQSTYFIPFEAFLVAIALYWAISLCIEGVMSILNRMAEERGLGRN